MKIKSIIQNKKALSEIISYVLLISIGLSLAAGVYSFMKFYVPKEDMGTQKCNENIVLIVNSYGCTDSVLSLKIENKGMFNIRGFILKFSADANKIPTEPLNATNKNITDNFKPGFYDFISAGQEILKPGEIITTNFSFVGKDKIERITIQPYNLNKVGNDLVLCDIVTDQRLNKCTEDSVTILEIPTAPEAPTEPPTEEGSPPA